MERSNDCNINKIFKMKNSLPIDNYNFHEI